MKISAIELQNVDIKKNQAFSGLKRTYNDNLKDVYRFYAPPYDKDKYALLLEVCAVKEDGNGGFVLDKDITDPHVHNNSYKQLRDSGVVEYPRDMFLSDPEENEYMGYRFCLVNKGEANKAANKMKITDDPSLLSQLPVIDYIRDPGIRVNDNQFGEFTVISNNMGITPKSGPASHIFYDSYDSAPGVDRSTFVRNHFNKAGGDLDGILKYKDEIEPYRYVMTNPYMGRDSVSSHKYWGEEFFQMPSPAKFKEVITELYKDGKGYIADGAITSQSLQSPMFQNVLKYGERSPFYNWFKINGRPAIGVFPDVTVTTGNKKEKVMENIGFKIVNPRGVAGYNSLKPSYIQFYDKRLASPEQQKDTKNLITAYANPNPKDHYDIAYHQDSVLPFYFELDYSNNDVREKFSGYTNKLLTDRDPSNKAKSDNSTILDHIGSFFSFENFDIVRKGKNGGANYWDGNVDIVKMNLANPNSNAGNFEGSEAAKKHMFGVAKYWTQFAQDSLLEYLAECFTNEDRKTIAHIAQANGLSEEELKAMMEYGKNDTPNSNAPVVSAKSQILDSLKNFRYESLSVSPQIAAVFASLDFREAMAAPEVKNRLFQFTIETLRKLDGCTQEDIIEPSSEVIDVLSSETNKREELNNEIKLTPYGQYMAKLLTPRIAGYAVLKAMFPDDEVYIDTNDNLLKSSKTLKERSLYETGVLQSGRPDDEAKQLAKIINKNLKREKLTEIQQTNLADELSSCNLAKFNLDAFKKAEVFLKKTGGGLNWRFDAAKDIGDLTSNRNGLLTFEDSWDQVSDFWGQFVKNIRDINPSSYVIAEVTDLWSFYNPDPFKKEARSILGPEASQEKVNEVATAIMEHGWGKYKNPDVAERMLYEKTGATTGSNYSTFFNLIPELYGRNFEHGNLTDDFANMNAIREKLNNYLKSGPLLSLTHSHIFVDNHDKPRGLHCMALDTGAYLSRFGINSNNLTNDDDIRRAKEAALRVLGQEPENYDIISSKGIVAGDFLKKGFTKVLSSDTEKMNLINEAIRDLALGKFKTKIEWDYDRGETFGKNPFDISINDVMEQAEYIAKRDNKEWFDTAKAEEIKNRVFDEVMTPSLSKMIQMSDLMNSLTGIPFFYAGDNLGQTGYEQAAKNISVANRNLIRHEWIDKGSDDYKPEIFDYYKRMQASASLYKEYGLSAIAGGMPVCLNQGNRNDLFAILKYDDKGSNVISVFTNSGMTADPYSEMEAKEPIRVKSISLKDDQGNIMAIGNSGSKEQYMKRKVYDDNEKKFVDEADSKGIPVKYVAINGELRRADGKDIEFKDTVSTFYKPLSVSKITHEDIMKRYYC